MGPRREHIGKKEKFYLYIVPSNNSLGHLNREGEVGMCVRVRRKSHR